MTLKVIGAGLGRTGTLSLKHALEALGLGPCYHMEELLRHPHHVVHWQAASRGEAPDWEALFAGYRSAVDYPVARYWRELAARYPEARVILTLRDPESWYESAKATIYSAGKQIGLGPKLATALRYPFSPRTRRTMSILGMLDRDIWGKDFAGRFEDKAFALDTYRRHAEAVKEALAPGRLLVYQVGEGWEPLCRFLDVPVPEQPFPRANPRADFAQYVQGLV